MPKFTKIGQNFNKDPIFLIQFIIVLVGTITVILEFPDFLHRIFGLDFFITIAE